MIDEKEMNTLYMVFFVSFFGLSIITYIGLYTVIQQIPLQKTSTSTKIQSDKF